MMGKGVLKKYSQYFPIIHKPVVMHEWAQVVNAGGPYKTLFKLCFHAMIL